MKYCLKCESQSCKCGNTNYQFHCSDKCRPPPTKNKMKFRLFLERCPIFPNMVPDELQEDFRNLLRKVKWKGGIINGHKWTKI